MTRTKSNRNIRRRASTLDDGKLAANIRRNVEFRMKVLGFTYDDLAHLTGGITRAGAWKRVRHTAVTKQQTIRWLSCVLMVPIWTLKSNSYIDIIGVSIPPPGWKDVIKGAIKEGRFPPFADLEKLMIPLIENQ